MEKRCLTLSPAPYHDPMVMVANIDGFIVKRVLVDSGGSFNILIWEAVAALNVNLTGLKRKSNRIKESKDPASKDKGYTSKS